MIPNRYVRGETLTITDHIAKMAPNLRLLSEHLFESLALREVGLSQSRIRVVEELLLSGGVARGSVQYLLR
jgi:hypothetical protein